MEKEKLYRSIKRDLENDKGRGSFLDSAFANYITLLDLLRKDGYDVVGHYSELSRIKLDIKLQRYQDAYSSLLSDFDALPFKAE